MRQTKRVIGLFVMLFGLSHCGGDAAYQLIPQAWKNIVVFVEVRPNPPEAGMNELLVVATRRDKRPAYDMIVSVSSTAQAKEVQTIQDGHSGIYRRAVLIDDPSKDSIKVHIQSREAGSEGDTVLTFPVALHTGVKH